MNLNDNSAFRRSTLMPSAIVTRFAPSPTGFLHLGHAYSALFAFDAAQRDGGRFVLRIEDIDFTRCQQRFDDALLEDLAWLGLTWELPVRRQSEHLSEYAVVAGSLKARGLLYPCFCTRKDILREIESAAGAPHGSESPVYPGHFDLTIDRGGVTARISFSSNDFQHSSRCCHAEDLPFLSDPELPVYPIQFGSCGALENTQHLSRIPWLASSSGVAL